MRAALFMMGLLISGSLFAQLDLDKQLDFSVQNLSIDQALLQLSQKSGYNISFSNDLLPSGRKITYSAQKQSFKAILTTLLQNTSLKYKTIGNQVVLYYQAPPKKRYTLSGYITDARTGEKLISATIYDPLTRKGTLSNAYGFYSITLPEGIYTFRFSYLGYQALQQKTQLAEDIEQDISLDPSLTLTEVVVIANEQNFRATEDISTDQIALEQFESLPSLGGEEDLIRMSHLLPGVQTGADGVGGIHIRGGNADQNSILLDEVPVYNPAHMVGVFSIFNSSAIKNAELIKGNFPARYGGRLSSVLNVRTKDGNNKQLGGEATLGLTSARLTLEGPLKREVGSFLVSGRHSFVNAFIRPVSEQIKEDNGQRGFSKYKFYDINAKLNMAVGKQDALLLSFYTGRDEYHNETTTEFEAPEFDYSYVELVNQDLDWGNTLGALRWNHLFGPRLFSNSILTFSRYSFQSADFYSFQDTIIDDSSLKTFSIVRFFSIIEDSAIKSQFDFLPNPDHHLRFGGGAVYHRFRPGVAALSSNSELSLPDEVLTDEFLDSLNNQWIRSYELHAFVEDEWHIGQKWLANIGFRASGQIVGNQFYRALEPRFGLRYQLSTRWALKVAYSRMTQYLHLLTNTGIGLPNDLWVPSSERVKPQQSWQTVLGLEHRVRNWFDIGLEAYYKKLDHIIAFQEGSTISFIDAGNYENNVAVGEGWAYGAELFLQREQGNTRSWFSYTLAWANRQFEDINLGRRFPFRYDRRHNLKLVLVQRLSEKWELSANWVYGTGLATTLPVSEYIFNMPSFFLATLATNFGEKNSLRLPAYHRLDVGANYRFGKSKWQPMLSFGIYNVYNRQNPLYYRLSRDNRDPFRPRESRYLQATILPILPYISYSIQFR